MIKIISGGQTGVDRAALDVAMQLKIQHDGWCPRGRVAEDGYIPDCYNLQYPTDNDSKEKDLDIYNERTKLNIRDSDGTLIFVPEISLLAAITDGTNLTIQEAKTKNKPYLIIDLSKTQDSEAIAQWLKKNKIKTLNVAGPRESQSPGIYKSSLEFLEKFLSYLLTTEEFFSASLDETQRSVNSPLCRF